MGRTGMAESELGELRIVYPFFPAAQTQSACFYRSLYTTSRLIGEGGVE
jgi:hypothetical protein